MTDPQDVIAGLCAHLRPLYDQARAQGARVVEASDSYGYAVRLDVGPLDGDGRLATPPAPAFFEEVPMQTYGYTRAYTCPEHRQQLGFDPARTVRYQPVPPARRSGIAVLAVLGALAIGLLVVLLD